MTVRAVCINSLAAANAEDALAAAQVIVTMNGYDVARISAALGTLCDHAPTANLRNDLMPILSAFNDMELI